MVDLDELIGIAGAIILVDMSHIELLWPDMTTYLSDGARAWKPLLPNGVTSLVGERRGGVDDLAL
jgi:hypothetical protein